MMISVWRETPFFTEAERVALELTEAATRLAESPDPATDDVWARDAKHFDETHLAAPVLQIANINVWNRLNVVTRQQPGVHTW
jgi:alkylhydroperoxidase family enzyme